LKAAYAKPVNTKGGFPMFRGFSLCLAAVLATTLAPAVSRAGSFAFGFDFYHAGSVRTHSWGDLDADIEELEAELRYTGQDWDLVVHYEVEVEDAPVGRCELVLEVVDRDFPSPPIRLTLPLDQPRKYDDDEIIYSARISTRIAPEHVRDPGRLRLHAYVLPVGGGPTLDHDSTRIKLRR